MCSSSQQTRETKSGYNIANTQTQAFLFWDHRHGVSTTERDNEWGRGTMRSSMTLRAASLTCLWPPRCWVEHSEIRTVVLSAWTPHTHPVRRCWAWSTPSYSLELPRRIFQNSVNTPLCSSPIQVKVTVSRRVVCPPRAHLPSLLRPGPTYTAAGSGCCGSGCGSSCCRPGRGWKSWRRKAGGSDCPWWGWGSRVGGAETLGPAGTRAAGCCGSDSGLWRVDGGCAEPDAQLAGCGAPTPSPLSADTTRRVRVL